MVSRFRIQVQAREPTALQCHASASTAYPHYRGWVAISTTGVPIHSSSQVHQRVLKFGEYLVAPLAVLRTSLAPMYEKTKKTLKLRK